MNSWLKGKFLLNISQKEKEGTINMISRKAFLSIYFFIPFHR